MKNDLAYDVYCPDQISEFDRDSLWSLPLLMIPLQSNALKNTRLVKNNQLEGVVEVFNDEKTGRGHVSPEKFTEFRDTIESSHLKIGALLCAMAIKMDHWSKQFPNPKHGGAMQRADFIVNDMAQGW